jgi:hypothetical protein
MCGQCTTPVELAYPPDGRNPPPTDQPRRATRASAARTAKG